MSLAATGRRTVWALGPEARPGEPWGQLQSYDPALPAAAAFTAARDASGTVNRSGYAQRAVPGAIEGAVEFGLPLAPPLLLPFLHHLAGSVLKTVLEPGVFDYVFEPQPAAAFTETTFEGLSGHPPVTLERVYDVRFSGLALEIGEGPILPRLTGQAGHRSPFGLAEPDPGNLGTHPGPAVRGIPRDDALDLWVEIRRDLAGGGVQFTTEQTNDPPTFPGPSVDLWLGPDGEPAWQNLQNESGVDVGFWGQNANYDPVEILWPGGAARLGELAVGDRWRIPAPGRWAAPAMPEAAAGGVRLLTPAMARLGVRLAGSSGPYRVIDRDSVTLTFTDTLSSTRRGRYPALYRAGTTAFTASAQRPLTDRTFLRAAEAHGVLDVRHELLGQQLGSGAHREAFAVTTPRAEVEVSVAAGDEGLVPESLTLPATAGENGEAPWTVRVVTDVDWTPEV